MEAQKIRKIFLDFFEKRGHKVVSSSSLIPDDPSVLLTTAGMQQFKPYYIGRADPMRVFGSKNTVSIQKSFRTSDIDEVGDESHLTFFEMLGNFSFGGYFKKEAIQYAYDFFKELNLPIEYISVFGGDDEVPADEESENIWRDLGIRDIRRMGRKDNFWGPTGSEGPCGPTTEIYVKGIEIWNIVFNQYYCKPDKTLVPLEMPGVDTGMGLERLAMVLQKKKNIFETDLLAPFLALLPENISSIHHRIIIDHLRASLFLISDGVQPSNKDRGAILRRLLRKSFTYEYVYKISSYIFISIIDEMQHEYGFFYPGILASLIKEEFQKEYEKFKIILEMADKKIDLLIRKKEKDPKTKLAQLVTKDFGSKSEHFINAISGDDAFYLHQTEGLPIELIEILLANRGYTYHKEEFKKAFEEAEKKHKEISRAGLEKKFGGHGLLLDTGELKAGNEEGLKIVTRLHTATHLLNAALRRVLGNTVEQRGSDITVERTRFDFLFPRKLTPEEIAKIEELVNDAIQKNFPITIQDINLEDAKKSGALFFYKGHYPEMVHVYTVGNDKETFSKELCGGPHVGHTGEIGHFKIIKEEASSAGVRRIRAIIQ